MNCVTNVRSWITIDLFLKKYNLIIRCLFRQLLLLSRSPRQPLYSNQSSQKHGKPPREDHHCCEDFPKAELSFNQSGLHRRCPYFIPEF
jgi:hypothetical protein